MNYHVTEPAEQDIDRILTETLRRFGARQVDIYAAIIQRGIDLVAAHPERPGSLDRSNIGESVRLFHLELAAGKRGAAAHCLYYITGKLPDGQSGTIILRVLHERMEPRGKLMRSLKVLVGSRADETA